MRSGQVRARTREDLFSVECPVGLCHDENEIQKVDDFMLSIANDDEDLKVFMQCMLRYCLTGEVSERCFFIWWGIGANGKTSICNLMKKILGPVFYATASKDVFIQQGFSFGSRTGGGDTAFGALDRFENGCVC